MNTAILYQIINLFNNKKYIGVTKRSIDRRFIEHLSRLKKRIHSSKEMQKDFDIYGRKAFKIELIKIGQFDEICLLEKELTKETIISGYNVIIGGLDSEERGNASRVYVNILKNNPEMYVRRLANLSKWNKGKIMSESAKKKMSEAKLGKKWKEEHKINRSIKYSGSGNPNAGKFSTYLNTQTGVYYNTPEILELLSISKSCLINYIQKKNRKINNFIKV